MTDVLDDIFGQPRLAPVRDSGVIPIRPEVTLTDGELAQCFDSVVRLMSGHPDIYVRDGSLVHIVTGDDGSPVIRPIRRALLRSMLGARITFFRPDKRAGGVKKTDCNDQLLSAVHEADSWDGTRMLAGIVQTPTMRPDGSLVTTPGFDAATGFEFIPSTRFPHIPLSPTQDDARAALRVLEDIYADFPFVAPVARSAAIAALLTLIARPAIEGSVPMIVCEASTRGVGKTLLADVAAVVALGRPAAKMSWPSDPIELEKVLSGFAVNGSPLIQFDNVSTPLGGGPLDRCLTAGRDVELRVLGKTEIRRMRWNAVVMATGNNISLAGDTSRRCLIARMETPLERPEDRTGFRHPRLLEHVLAHRGTLVQAALTILRAWVVAGRPPLGLGSWGSFEAWAAMIPPAIVFAGGADPLQARAESIGVEDPDKAALSTLLELWPLLDTGGGMTITNALKALYPGGKRPDGPPDQFDGLREVLEYFDPKSKQPYAPQGKAIAYQMRRFANRVVGGKRLMRRTNREKVQLWFIDTVLSPASPASPAEE